MGFRQEFLDGIGIKLDLLDVLGYTTDQVDELRLHDIILFGSSRLSWCIFALKLGILVEPGESFSRWFSGGCSPCKPPKTP